MGGERQMAVPGQMFFARAIEQLGETFLEKKSHLGFKCGKVLKR
jgi:hypothetical protein